METFNTQLLTLLPFIGLGLLLTLAYVADGRHEGDGSSEGDGKSGGDDPDDSPDGTEGLERSASIESAHERSAVWRMEDRQSGGEPLLRWAVLAVLGMSNLAAIFFGASAALIGVSHRLGLIDPSVPDMGSFPMAESGSSQGRDLGVDPDSAEAAARAAEFMTTLMDTFLPLGTISIALGLVGFLLLVPMMRRMLSRLIPIDPHRLVHTVALHFALLLVYVSAVIAYLIPIIAADPDGGSFISQTTAEAGLIGIWMQNAGFALLGILGVGLFATRGPRAALRRLGLTPWIDVRWWAGATVIALAASWGVDTMWSIVSPESLSEVERLSELLFEPIIAYGLAGALTIGLAAGIGEEILFRGAMQPRFGLALTALLFAALHTQYTVSLALVQIFVVALLLGFARQRANTTTAIAIHATYNFVLAMAAVMSA